MLFLQAADCSCPHEYVTDQLFLDTIVGQSFQCSVFVTLCRDRPCVNKQVYKACLVTAVGDEAGVRATGCKHQIAGTAREPVADDLGLLQVSFCLARWTRLLHTVK